MTLLDRHRRLRTIGRILLQNEQLSDEDREFLGNALVAISNGEDTTAALEIKLKKGQSSYKSQLDRDKRDKEILGWIAAAKAPLSEGGLGLTLDKAMELLNHSSAKEKPFGLNVDTIRKYWNNRPNQRSIYFELED